MNIWEKRYNEMIETNVLAGKKLASAEGRVKELLQDREILHQDGERWRNYGNYGIKVKLEALALCGELIAMIRINVARDIFRTATIEEVEEHLKPWIERLRNLRNWEKEGGGEHLFDMDSVAMDSPRLAEIKAADIQTHHAPHMDDEPWLAIPMNAARERLKGYITKDEPFETVADITATYGIVLEDCGMLFYGETQRDAEDKALSFLNAKSPSTGANEKGNG